MTVDEKIKLLCRISSSNSAQEITDLAYELLGNPVFIADTARTVLAYTKCVNIDSPYWLDAIENAKFATNMAQRNADYVAVHIDSSKSKKPILVTDDRMPFPRIVKTLVVSGRVVGSIVLTAYHTPFSDEDLDLIELLSYFVLLLLERGRFLISSNENGVENFLIQLLDGANYDAKAISDRLDMLGYTVKPIYYVLALSPQNSEGTMRNDLPHVLEDLRQLPFLRFFLYDSYIICLYGSDREIALWDHEAHRVHELMQKWKLTAGVSHRFKSFSHLRKHFKQAVDTLETGLKLKRNDLFFVYDNFSIFHMFQQLPGQSAGQYCHQKVRELAAYDMEHNTNFCQTLQVYLKTAKNQQKTSEILKAHRNTIHYRINRCMELLQTDLEDGDEIFTYILSLRILEFENKILNKQFTDLK